MLTPRYAVFPERLEVMSASNLMKVVGRVNGELVTIEGRLRDSGWALIMPEAPGDGMAASPPVTTQTPLANMMRWVTGE
jgi:CCR4-NOT transcriptional complex subunit CAF120